ncbi:hypothetical protein [Undibacterium squillarum]|uniref:HK97 gp10 family phage protein n=1 Tax=Undibacterium squillarum TaxID=1131567 RepID=A0ABQ2Y3E8_9BURK|nr:hypothetical protein [Undibacterium squillarum]GGX53082.1 hypothetical protein GCM10010946_34590 [Undibacterium squillarum]
MITITVKGAAEIVATIDSITQSQLPFATARALTQTARAGRQAATEEIDRAFDSPTSFTRRAIAFRPADKATLTAAVFVKDDQAQYLAPQVFGGKRDFKPFEERFGKTLTGLFAFGGKAAKRNAAGNLSRAEITKIAKGLGGNYFVLTAKSRPDIQLIAMRSKDKKEILPQLVFVTKANYKPRYKFGDVVRQASVDVYEKEFRAAWDAAIKTMRR